MVATRGRVLSNALLWSRGQGACELAFKIGDLRVEQADLGKGGPNDGLEHGVRDRIRAHWRCSETADQLGARGSCILGRSIQHLRDQGVATTS